MGIIDTLSAGFGTINRRPWVIGVPVLIDLFLWLGPRLSADSVFERVLTFYQRMGAPDQASAQLSELVKQLSGTNIFSVLVWQLPSIMNSPSVFSFGERAVLTVQSSSALLGIGLALGILGLVCTCLYLSGIARLVNEDALGTGSYLGNLLRNFQRLAGYFLLLLLIMVVLGIPFLVTVTLVGLLSPGLASFLMILGIAALFWLLVYLFFAIYAIFVGGRSPMRAIWDSVNIVARNFWPALWMFALIHVILLGTGIAWSVVLSHPVGVVTAMLGNAYIASGLAAAAMIFYRERAEQSAVRPKPNQN